jgi:hypothetical protein
VPKSGPFKNEGIHEGRTIRAESDLVDQLFNSSEKRLARLLLLLANFGKEDKPEPMITGTCQRLTWGFTRQGVRIGVTSAFLHFFQYPRSLVSG